MARVVKRKTRGANSANAAKPKRRRRKAAVPYEGPIWVGDLKISWKS